MPSKCWARSSRPGSKKTDVSPPATVGRATSAQTTKTRFGKKMAEQIANERVVEGLGVSPGIGIGNAYVCESGRPRIPEYRIRPADVEAEQRRLREAALRARRQLGRLRTKTLGRVKANAGWASEDVLYLLDA